MKEREIVLEVEKLHKQPRYSWMSNWQKFESFWKITTATVEKFFNFNQYFVTWCRFLSIFSAFSPLRGKNYAPFFAISHITSTSTHEIYIHGSTRKSHTGYKLLSLEGGKFFRHKINVRAGEFPRDWKYPAIYRGVSHRTRNLRNGPGWRKNVPQRDFIVFSCSWKEVTSFHHLVFMPLHLLLWFSRGLGFTVSLILPPSSTSKSLWLFSLRQP